jgi:hemolysin III
MTERSQTLGEEIANSVSHGVALLAALVAVPFLITTTGHLGTTHLIGASVFAATLVALYLSSTLYHALPSGPTKQLFMKLDHCAIYLFIAGSYTPFALVALEDTWSWLLFGLVWAFAFFGVALKAFDRLSHPWISTGLYLVMGWLVLFAAIPLVERVPQLGITFLVAGGVAYTVGVVFFVLDSRVRYAHAVWHGFVVTGSGFHLFAVLNYSA